MNRERTRTSIQESLNPQARKNQIVGRDGIRHSINKDGILVKRDLNDSIKDFKESLGEDAKYITRNIDVTDKVDEVDRAIFKFEANLLVLKSMTIDYEAKLKEWKKRRTKQKLLSKINKIKYVIIGALGVYAAIKIISWIFF